MPRAPDLSGHALDGRYELRELIGEGAFGCVYRGFDRRLARPVAVKVIKPWWSEDPDWVRSFEREAQLLARVSDPGIVQIYDVGEAAEGIYYVAELVKGESLAARLRRGPMPPREACELAIQLCSALDGAHAQGVVHRDVKPANVLVSAAGQVKVGDFGVALLAEGSTGGAVATIVGTPRYMAPEQAQGRVPTPATDVYSVGVVLYEMLSGRPPFAGATSVELAMSHLNDPPPPLPDDVPEALERIVVRALAKRPEERYESAGAMAEALARTLPDSDATVPSRPVPAPRQNGDHTAATRVAAREPPPTATRVAGGLTPRRTVNPAARRRTTGLFALVLAVLLAMAVGAVLLAQPSTVRVPDLRGLSRARAGASVRRAGLQADFISRFDGDRRGTVISQDPRAGAKLDRGAPIKVTLSAGPPPVKVPSLEGRSVADARKALSDLGLRASVTAVPAPSTAPGTVTHQSPGAATELAPGSTVSLNVSETPQWRTITSFAGTGAGHSVPFRIRGKRWRIVYSMGYDGSCTLIFFCSGPSAQVKTLRGGQGAGGFDLSDGANQTKELDSGAGVYQVTVSPGSDTAHWSMRIQDYY